jgi:hypothetical protein
VGGVFAWFKVERHIARAQLVNTRSAINIIQKKKKKKKERKKEMGEWDCGKGKGMLRGKTGLTPVDRPPS